MRLVDGMRHVTLLTADLDRLAAFYERVLDSRKTLDMTEEGVRHAYLEVGATIVLHAFQIPAARALDQGPPDLEAQRMGDGARSAVPPGPS
jgi:catechol 2,3-dioxygenase-like lactoylglutathione lyase family enzyme